MKIKPTHYHVQCKIFEMAGCVYARTKGDHLIYHYPGAVRPVVIPKYKEVPTFVITDLVNWHYKQSNFLDICQCISQYI